MSCLVVLCVCVSSDKAFKGILIYSGVNPGGQWAPAPWCDEEALHLASRLLDFDPENRLSLEEALQHPFLLPLLQHHQVKTNSS